MFNFFFTSRLTSKFAIKSSLSVSPHLKCLATLPCDVSLITIHVSGCCYSLTLIFHKIQEIGCEEHPQNNLISVEWDAKL